MSYDLYFKCLPGSQPPRKSSVLEYFRQRPHYEVTDFQAIYENHDTGVYFILDYDDSMHEEREDPSLLPIAASINYVRPHFFALESRIELEAFAKHFGLIGWSSQSGQDVGLGGDELCEDWLRSNERSVKGLIQSGELPTPIRAHPTAALEQIWAWNYGRQALQESLGESIFVPAIMMLDLDGQLRSAVVWADAIPIALPIVSHLILFRQQTAPRRLFKRSQDTVLKPYADCEPLILSFQTVRDTLPYKRLSYAQAPTELVSFFRNSKAFRGKLPLVRFDEILNEELVSQAGKPESP